MSRVTFSDLYTDYLNVNTSVEDCKKVGKVEIVPRKIVEMIIAECNSQISDFKGNPRIVNTATYIKNYAESLLRQFEEESE